MNRESTLFLLCFVRMWWTWPNGAILWTLLVFVGHIDAVPAAEPPMAPICTAIDPWFAEEVWAKVGERVCANCHHAKGDANESRFLLDDTLRDPTALLRNYRAFADMAQKQHEGVPRLLAKATGRVKHGGGAVVKANSTEFRILTRFVERLQGREKPVVEPPSFVPGPYFAQVTPLSPQRLLRRVTLALVGRLPTLAEREAVEKAGYAAVDRILDDLMKEDAFYDRLREAFNDIFLLVGYPGLADDVLSYEHFEKSRRWYQTHDLSHIPEKDRQKARYALADLYRAALLREPYELIAYIVRQERPFTEIVTADYQMMSPYTARGYGMYEELKSHFKNPEDPFEYIPVQLKALTSRSGKTQPTQTGKYPHAGLLTTFQYLRRYPTTVTNRNRLRARMYYQHFLGVDVMTLAPRVTDATAVSKKFDIPTMQASECVVCHKIIDPVAGVFQDYFNEEGHYGPRKEGWFSDMFAPGREGEELPREQKWRALQWLGAATAQDPRFAVAMVEHVYTILMGRRPLLPPQDPDDPYFSARRRAYLEQRQAIQAIAERFAKENFNLKVVFKAWIASPFYRADGLAEVVRHPERRAELDDIGLMHLLTPEQLERKIEAIFGQRWGKMIRSGSDQRLAILYGGIDSREVTQRMTEPSGAMGAIQRMLANDVACQHVAKDFDKPAAQRRLFPEIEIDVLPDGSAENERRIRAAIVYLHALILGQEHDLNHPEVNRTYDLFVGILREAKIRKYDPREQYSCQAEPGKKTTMDPYYTIRAWRAVVTYLLRQDDFLYE